MVAVLVGLALELVDPFERPAVDAGRTDTA